MPHNPAFEKAAYTPEVWYEWLPNFKEKDFVLKFGEIFSFKEYLWSEYMSDTTTGRYV